MWHFFFVLYPGTLARVPPYVPIMSSYLSSNFHELACHLVAAFETVPAERADLTWCRARGLQRSCYLHHIIACLNRSCLLYVLLGLLYVQFYTQGEL